MDRELSGFFITRRVSEGRTREDIASDITPSLAYASGCDCYEKRNFKTRERGAHEGKLRERRKSIPHLRFGLG
jgi:hypothetical protein